MRASSPGRVIVALTFLGLLALNGACRPAQAEDGPITVETPAAEDGRHAWLAEPPCAGERSVQFSSYDRASASKDGKIVNPFANGDRGHYLRVEGEGDRREWVLAEARGPATSRGSGAPTRTASCGSTSTGADARPGRALRRDHQWRGRPVHGPVRPRRLAGPEPVLPVPVREVDQDHHHQGRAVLPGQRHDPARGNEVESYSPEVLARARRRSSRHARRS